MSDNELVPPEHLRLGIGPFSDPQHFLDSGFETVQLAKRIAGLRPHHSVLDVGCGCGRVALALRSFLSDQGSYVGFDLNHEYVQWCTSNISKVDDRFTFQHYNLISEAYNPNGKISPATLEFPVARQFDLAILSSVFTHMYPEEIINYVSNLHRVLAPGGRALISALLMNPEAVDAVATGRTIFDFSHRIGDSCWTFNPECPLEGIACDIDWLLGLFQASGFEVETLEYGTWRQIRRYEVQHDWCTIKRRGS